MHFVILLLCVIATCVLAEDVDQDFLELSAPIGKIRGSLMKSRLGKTIYSFRGLRYAEPPIGQQRFKVSVLVVWAAYRWVWLSSIVHSSLVIRAYNLRNQLQRLTMLLDCWSITVVGYYKRRVNARVLRCSTVLNYLRFSYVLTIGIVSLL